MAERLYRENINLELKRDGYKVTVCRTYPKVKHLPNKTENAR